MTVVSRSVVCDRVRSQISLRLDGDLSQLESRMVDAHLVRCAQCSAFESGAVALTDLLRAAPLEPLETPVVVRFPARTWVARAQLGAAAALALVAFGVASQLAQRPSDANFAKPESYPTSLQLEREIKQIVADAGTFSEHSGDVIPI